MVGPHRVEHHEDEEWQTFLDAFPSPDAVQWFADARAVGTLVHSGDDLAGPRTVTHWLLFPSAEAWDTARLALAAELKPAEQAAYDEASQVVRAYMLRRRREDPGYDWKKLLSEVGKNPEELVVDLSEREMGDTIRMSDITLPKGAAATITDRDFVIATLKVSSAALSEINDEAAAGGDAEA